MCFADESFGAVCWSLVSPKTPCASRRRRCPSKSSQGTLPYDPHGILWRYNSCESEDPRLCKMGQGVDERS